MTGSLATCVQPSIPFSPRPHCSLLLPADGFLSLPDLAGFLLLVSEFGLLLKAHPESKIQEQVLYFGGDPREQG